MSGTVDIQIKRLQSIQNAAARLESGSSMYDAGATLLHYCADSTSCWCGEASFSRLQFPLCGNGNVCMASLLYICMNSIYCTGVKYPRLPSVAVCNSWIYPPAKGTDVSGHQSSVFYQYVDQFAFCSVQIATHWARSGWAAEDLTFWTVMSTIQRRYGASASLEPSANVWLTYYSLTCQNLVRHR